MGGGGGGGGGVSPTDAPTTEDPLETTDGLESNEETTKPTTSEASSTTGSTTSEASSTTGYNTATWKAGTGTTPSTSEEPDDDDDDEPEEGSLEALTNWAAWDRPLDEEDIIWFQGNMLMAGGEEDGDRGGMLGALLNMGARDDDDDVSPEPPVENPRIEELTDWAPVDKEVDGEELIWFRGDSLADILDPEAVVVRGWPSRGSVEPMMRIKMIMERLKMRKMAQMAVLNGPMIGGGKDDKDEEDPDVMWKKLMKMMGGGGDP